MSGMGWMMAADIAKDIGGIWAQSSAAHNANRTNIRLQREAQEWSKMMSDTAVTRHVMDLKNAGLNPMLGYTGQAATPNVPPARVEPTYKGGGMGDITSKMLLASQVANINAQSRLTNAEALIRENQVPHSAGQAQASLDKIQEEIVRLGQDIERNDIGIQTDRMNQAQLEKMQPLLLEGQRLMNQALQFGMSRKELESNIAKMFGIPFEYAGEAIDALEKIGSGVGRAVADGEEWFREKWQQLKKEATPRKRYYDPDTKNLEEIRE